MRRHRAGAVLDGALLLGHGQRTAPLSVPGVTLATYTPNTREQIATCTSVRASSVHGFTQTHTNIRKRHTNTPVQTLVVCTLRRKHQL